MAGSPSRKVRGYLNVLRKFTKVDRDHVALRIDLHERWMSLTGKEASQAITTATQENLVIRG